MIETITEIARVDWARTLDEFNAIHDGWLVTVQVSAPEFGTHPEFVDLPLAGVFFEVGETAKLSIVAATDGGRAVHIIEQPERLWMTRADDHVDAQIEIEAADRARTVLRFTHPALPETVDGLPRPRPYGSD